MSTMMALLMSSEVPEFVCTAPAAVLGDIHGSFAALQELLPKLGDRELFVIGDVCDRGPDTKRVIDLLVSKKARGVLGNHEEWFRQWVCEGTFRPKAAYGGMGSRATLASYGVAKDHPVGAHRAVPDSHRAWLEGLEHVAGLTVCGDRFWMVHAGISPLLVRLLSPRETTAAIVPRLYRERDHYALWNDSRPEDCPAVDRPVIMGHKPRAEPWLTNHVLAIDTGAGTTRTGRLSALLLPERRTISVEAPGDRP
jgi:serine/threonine protein phosphatase 1